MDDNTRNMSREKKNSWYEIRNKYDRYQYRKNSKKFYKAIKEARRSYAREKLDLKIVYSYVRSKMKVREQIP